MMPTSLSAGDESQEQEPQNLSCRDLITFATLGRVEIDAADHHGQRHGINLDRQRSGVPATWYLEAPSLQTLRPNDHPITIPKQYLAAIPRAIHEDEIVAAENVHAE
jgi:hypothetical protein